MEQGNITLAYWCFDSIEPNSSIEEPDQSLEVDFQNDRGWILAVEPWSTIRKFRRYRDCKGPEKALNGS
jgi:hypothetical protein